ncbi:hypothetical protein B0H63DRAFT_445575 [Podospora didyma]|uniref:Uncharacterized protein n=1 Tax=Podospora didyma TaxID=330526 RepID=A0AAE0NXD5_9PEZI|nr:hypothetical protein B0H63DRAFT_445575 [Podospora didyma]
MANIPGMESMQPYLCYRLDLKTISIRVRNARGSTSPPTSISASVVRIESYNSRQKDFFERRMSDDRVRRCGCRTPSVSRGLSTVVEAEKDVTVKRKLEMEPPAGRSSSWLLLVLRPVPAPHHHTADDPSKQHTSINFVKSCPGTGDVDMIGSPNPRLKREPFSTADGPSEQHTGISFDKSKGAKEC